MELLGSVTAAAVAVAAGALIGAEREQAQTDESTSDFGGIRTFPLLALLGAVSGLLRPIAGVWVLVVSLGAVATLLAITHARRDDPGLTSEVAAVLTFVLGVMAATPEILPDAQRYLLVASLAAVTMALLALKRPLHRFMARVSPADVFATAKFVLLALVLLPILPHRTFGPLDVLNPFKIGLMIVLVAGISFAGYVAARVIGGKRGLLVTGLVGGLVSSTAVTLTFSGRAKTNPELAPLCAVAILVACATMFGRVLVVVGIVDRPLLPALAAPLAAMAVVAVAVTWWIHKRSQSKGEEPEEVRLRNPFELKQAAKFGLLYAAILFVAKAANVYGGEGGVIASSVLGGITDVDAVTLSLVELHQEGMASSLASAGVLLAAATNTLVKAGIATFIGGWALGKRVALGLLAALAAGGAAFAVTLAS